MKHGVGIVRLAWVLLGLLVIASVAFELGQPKTLEEPYAGSFDPSGAAAFVELLRREGYQVQIDAVLPASLPPEVFALTFIERDEIGLPLEPEEGADSPESKKQASPNTSGGGTESPYDTGPDYAPPSIRLIAGHLRRGGNALILGYDPALALRGGTPVGGAVIDPAQRTYNVSLPPGADATAADLIDADAALPAWVRDKRPFANLDQFGSGRAIVVGSGEIAMNSYVDQADNAKLLLDQIHLLAPKGAKVDVLDGSISGAAGGLIEALGPWAHGVQLQLILVGVVIVYTLGKRFGLADETPRAQPGARNLLDGIADTYDRGRAAKAGLQAVLQDADRAARRQMKLASDAPLRKRNEMLPAALAQALTAAEHALMQDPSPSEALALARNLDTELDLFLQHRRPPAKRVRRRVNSV